MITPSLRHFCQRCRHGMPVMFFFSGVMQRLRRCYAITRLILLRLLPPLRRRCHADAMLMAYIRWRCCLACYAARLITLDITSLALRYTRCAALLLRCRRHDASVAHADVAIDRGTRAAKSASLRRCHYATAATPLLIFRRCHCHHYATLFRHYACHAAIAVATLPPCVTARQPAHYFAAAFASLRAYAMRAARFRAITLLPRERLCAALHAAQMLLLARSLLRAASCCCREER